MMTRRLLSLVALGWIAACGNKVESSNSERFEVLVHVQSDDTSPLAGVSLQLAAQKVGVTDAQGQLSLRLRGTEGQALELGVTCPSTHEPMLKPVSVRLTRARRLDQKASEPLTQVVTCTRRERELVIVTHLDSAVGVPVLVDGTRVAVTDARGDAEAVVRVRRDARAMQLSLDPKTPRFDPIQSARTYELAGKDAVLLFAPKLAAAPVARRRASTTAPKKRHVPTRIN